MTIAQKVQHNKGEKKGMHYLASYQLLERPQNFSFSVIFVTLHRTDTLTSQTRNSTRRLLCLYSTRPPARIYYIHIINS